MTEPIGSPLLRSPGVVSVLEEDVELAGRVDPARRERAQHASRAHLAHVRRGRWDAQADAEACRGGHGLLVLSGLLMRRVEIDRHFGAELLGPGDPLSPLEMTGDVSTIAIESTWRVVEPLRLALLDRDWSFRMARHPEVAIELASRAVRRSRRLANTLAISQHPRLEPRLHLLFWELADRYGRVGPDGVHVPLPITHELLSHLAAARRPSVSAALKRLSTAGLVERRDGEWILHGDAPVDADYQPVLLVAGEPLSP
jgi:CRP/FNR family cyclic AMP-dependent transcriptional regulator